MTNTFPEATTKALRFLREQPLDKGESDLLEMMLGKAAKEESYATAFSSWLLDGATIELRELARPFGDWLRDLKFANAVDGIDSAHLHSSFRYKKRKQTCRHSPTTQPAPTTAAKAPSSW